LAEQQVVEVGGVDGGDTVVVAGDGDGGGEAGDGEVAVEQALVLGEGCAEVAAKVEGEDNGREDEQDEEDARGEEKALAPDAAGFAGGLCGFAHALERF
jgi:hypothetical protein